MNGRLDHPITDPHIGENYEIFKNRSHGRRQVFQRDIMSEALVLRVLGASGTAGSALVGRPTEACSLRPFGSRSSPRMADAARRQRVAGTYALFSFSL